MPIKMRAFLWNLFIVVTIVFVIPSSGLAKSNSNSAQQNGQSSFLCITAAPSTATFPVVALNFRMIDTNLRPIIPTDGDLRFSENDKTPVPLIGSIQRDPTGAGINYYIIVDKGNRTLQSSARSVLQTLSNYVDEKTDKVEIYTNEKNEARLFYPGMGLNSFTQAVSNFPIDYDSQPRQIMQSFAKVLEEVEGNSDVCQNTRVIILIMGDEAILKNDLLSFAQRAKNDMAKLVIFHLGGLPGSTFESRQVYSDLAKESGGIYQQVISLDNDIRPVLDDLTLFKQVFSASYRTNNGLSGAHNIGATYQNATISVRGQSTYQLNILPPEISLEGQAVITRKAQKATEAGDYLYDLDNLPYVIKIKWPDSNPREIKRASLIVKEGDSENEIPAGLTSKGDNAYELIWNFAQIKQTGGHTLYLSVKITDEFDNQAVSAPLQISLTNNVESLPGGTTSRVLMWTLYVLGGIVVILILLMIFMWRKMLSFAKQGGAAIGKIAGEIRKTIVGGGKRGKPLATFKVIDAQPNMIGQELKIYTESVKLGRNPQLADMTFYGPDVITSVSGLHARVEKFNGAWRIVALSQSGSETFLDDQPIPFNEPCNLRNGQKIRLGYYAQQPVVLEFQTNVPENSHSTMVEQTDDPRRKTEVKIDPNETILDGPAFSGKPNKKMPVSKKQASEESDSVFDEFR